MGEVPWILVEVQQMMLTDFAVVIEVVYVLGTWQNKKLPDVLISHNNHKRDPYKECCTH
jgi:hypothetical protein